MSMSPPKLKWAFPINPAYAWFENFADCFSSPDITFIVDIEDDKPNAYAFSSAHLSELRTPAEIWARAASLKAVLDGAFYLLHGKDFRPFRFHDLVSLSDGRSYHSVVDEYELIAPPFREDSSSWISSWESLKNPFNSFTSAMLWLAREDNRSRGLLQFLGYQGCTWIALYALLDFMKTGGLSAKEIAALSKTSEAEIKRFTHTANNFSAIGPLCRHGDLGQQPPSKPMLLSEAAAIVFPAAREFLEKRVLDMDLQSHWEKSKE